MKPKILWVIAVLATATLVVPAAMADSDTTYNLTFNGSNTASYTWDSTTDKFSNFMVTSQYGTGDITAFANQASGGLSTTQEQALLLGGSGYWSSYHDTTNTWGFTIDNETNGIFADGLACATPYCNYGQLGQSGSTWSDVAASPVTAPEGSSLAMMGMTGIGLLAAFKRKFLTR